ncbi:MAG: helix-turn-helix domain-containing protein [Bacillota bacterium]
MGVKHLRYAGYVKRCLQNETNPSYEAKQLGIDKNTVTDWIRKYRADGYEGLKNPEDVKYTQGN